MFLKSAGGVFIQPVQDPATTALPLWMRIAHSVREAIAGGTLGRGDRLPSARQLAADWRVSRGAVDEAFAQLQLEGLIEGRVGAGTYVRRAEAAAPVLRRQAAPHAQRVLQRSLVQGCAPSRLESARSSLRLPTMHPRSTEIDTFPLATWRRLVLQAHADAQRALQAGVPAGGLPGLREAIARHLAVHRGVSCSAEQVLVTNGAGDGMQLVGRLLLQPGDTMWIEDPSHASLPLLMRTLGLNVVGVPLDAAGLDVAAGQRLAPRARLCFLHPLTQYPLGVATSSARREALRGWAEQHGAWIVEGHMNDEMVPPVHQPAALMAHDPNGRVLMLGTFEGVMFPSLRVAYLVLPQALAANFVAAAAAFGEPAPATLQWALAEFIDRGHMTRHLQALRALVRRRRDVVRRTLLNALPAGVRPGPMNHGEHLCLHLPAALADTEVALRLRARRLIVEPLSAMAWQVQGLNGIVLGYGGLDDTALVPALQAVVDTLAELSRPAAYQPAGENA